MSLQTTSRRATISDRFQTITASAHKRNKSASTAIMSKMPGNKRAFGVDVSNSRKELNTVAGTVGYKKNNYENVNPNVSGDNVKGLNAPAVRPTNGGMIATKTQVSLNAAKPASGSVAQATYPVNGAQAARPRALSKRANNATVFRDEENLNTVLPSIETEGAPAPPAHQALVVNKQAFELADDDLSPALARLSVSPSLSASPSQKVAVPTADGGVEVWDSEDEYDQGYASAEDDEEVASVGVPAARISPLFNAGIFSDVQTRKLQVAAHFVKKAYTRQEMLDDLRDITMCAEYADEIFAYMNEVEIKNVAPHDYMEGFQTEVKPDMRRILMDWLVQVHGRFNMLPETLFLAVNYIDRFLASKVVSLGKLQLVGATAILLAAKVEEVNAPNITEIVYMVDDTYGADEVLKAERFMLGQLKWEMQFPGPMSFLRRISKADDYDIEVRTMAKYFLEIMLMDYRFAAVPPSFAAASAVCLSREILMKGKWTPAHAHYSGYTGTQLLPICNMMMEILRLDPLIHHNAVYEKYSHRRYNQFSITCQDILKGTWSGKKYELPQILDDGKIFDYEEPCDGNTAFLRSTVMATIRMLPECREYCEEIMRQHKAQADLVRLQQEQAQAYALIPFGFQAPRTDGVSA